MNDLGRTLLEHLGYCVHPAKDGADAVKLLAQLDHVALAFVDISLPDTRGDILARTLLKMRPNLKILLVSGSPDALQGLPEPLGEHVLAKPYDLETLSSAIRRALE